MNLETLRDEIDSIDEQLVKLFVERMEIVRGVAEYKIENDLPIFHPERELKVIEKAVNRAPEEMKEYVEDFFNDVMKTSKKMQEKLIEDK